MGMPIIYHHYCIQCGELTPVSYNDLDTVCEDIALDADSVMCEDCNHAYLEAEAERYEQMLDALYAASEEQCHTQ